MTPRRTVALVVALVLVALGTAGTIVWMRSRNAKQAEHTAQRAAEVWTCPMHPEVREPHPGKCPKCGMDLVKETATAAPPSEETPRAAVQLDTRRRQLLNVRTVRVERRPLVRDVRAVGIVRYDETRLADVNLKLDGWVKTLHVDSTGQPVRRGQPLLDVYSPELLASQNEFLLALATRESMQQSQVADARANAERLVQSARQRLLLWDLPPEELEDLERTRKADGTVTFRSPVSGFVIEKPVVSGMRVMPGQTLYKVADLSTVWVEADIHETDAAAVTVGTTAVVTLDAWPGESLTGKAVSIYPFVEEQTRTIRVRLAFANRRLRLKPGMYANVALTTASGSGLMIPADALLDSGREQLVFVAEGDGHYQPRPVEAGRRFDDRVEILSGLAEGEEVAAGAAFFLDSESQLRAAAGGWEAATPEAGTGGTRETHRIDFRTEPSPPRSGENTFEVRIVDPAGTATADVQVKLVLYMPAMPSMAMPAMTSEVALAHTGGGVYRGTGMIPMAGRWDVTITATKAGRRVASRHATLTAK